MADSDRAFVGNGQGPIFTARIRKMTEGNIFSLFTLAGEGGTPHPADWGGVYPHPRSGWWVPHPADGGDRVPPSQVRMGGYPHPGPRSGWGGGSFPIPGQDGGTPPFRSCCRGVLTGVYPHPRSGWGEGACPGPR